MNPTFRSDSLIGIGRCTTIREVEKRRLFLRSYQFSRKESGGRRVKRSTLRVKRLIWVKLRSTKMIWFRLRHGFFNGFKGKSCKHLTSTSAATVEFLSSYRMIMFDAFALHMLVYLS
ncbi:hypothetical protein L1987_77977 [Smallanthus sonchifolius]|uniref:Uncharacterized protein n=1 Tax=Smallanthus sonchifolius TaxID=185202 RepID=A0ACB8ZFU5_9ASTR|nr:hypothetical protein L1987_77977 [Smallanthus sonchifolius]